MTKLKISVRSTGNPIRHLLFCWDISLGYRCTLNICNLHVVLNLTEFQSQVLATDSHQRSSLTGSSKRGDL